MPTTITPTSVSIWQGKGTPATSYEMTAVNGIMSSLGYGQAAETLTEETSAKKGLSGRNLLLLGGLALLLSQSTKQEGGA